MILCSGSDPDWNYLTVQLNRTSEDELGDPDLYGLFYNSSTEVKQEAVQQACPPMGSICKDFNIHWKLITQIKKKGMTSLVAAESLGVLPLRACLSREVYQILPPSNTSSERPVVAVILTLWRKSKSQSMWRRSTMVPPF